MRPDQEKIAEWLTKKAPELAQVYVAAVRLLQDPIFPGRVKFICHAGRDICNRFPEVIAVQGSFGHVDLTGELDELSDLWIRYQLDGRAFPPISAVGPEAQQLAYEIPIPLHAFKQVAAVLLLHRQPQVRTREKAERMVEAVAPENVGRNEMLRPLADQWQRLTRWFPQYAHAGLKERDLEEEELQEKFYTLENCIAAIMRENDGEFYEGVKILDEILEDANL